MHKYLSPTGSRNSDDFARHIKFSVTNRFEFWRSNFIFLGDQVSRFLGSALGGGWTHWKGVSEGVNSSNVKGIQYLLEASTTTNFPPAKGCYFENLTLFGLVSENHNFPYSIRRVS